MYEESVVDAGSSRSSFQELKVKEHVTLLPSYLGRVGEGVTELLSSRLLFYNSLYSGVLLSFTSIRVLQRVGEIFDELPHIHINIEYTATVFRPQVGDVMCGRVNNVGLDHIGCLLFKCFNVSVTCTRFDQQSQEIFERRLHSWCNQEFSAGEELWFSVSGVEVAGDLPALRGEYLMQEEITQPRPKKKKKRKKDIRLEKQEQQETSKMVKRKANKKKSVRASV